MGIRVLGLKSNTTTAESHRHGLSLFMTPSGGPLHRRSGIVPYAGSADLVGVTGTMQAAVKPFGAWIDGTSATVQAGYPFTCDADVPLTFDPGEAAVARVDQVIARVKDHPYDASGAQDGFVEILKGQASGAASPLPASSLLLWEVTVPAGASAGTGGINWATARTDRRRFTAALGGMVVVTGRADRDSITNPYDGFGVWRNDIHRPEFYTGTGWVDPAPPPLFDRTNSDQPMANSTAFVAHNDLAITVPPNTLYELSGIIFYSAHQDADLKIGWIYPNNSWMDWTIHGLAGSSTGNVGPTFYDRQFRESTPWLGGQGANNTYHLAAPYHGMFYSGDGGQLQLRWAQVTAHPIATYVRNSTYIAARPLQW